MSVPVVRAIAADEIGARHAELGAFEAQFVYPLGQDTFRIDHGADYLAFFRSLGEPVVLIAERDGELLGVCVAVQRPFLEPAWYLCDLKVAPAGRGLGLARALMQACVESCLLDGRPAFGVSMNPADGPNRMARIAPRFAPAKFEAGPQILIYSLQNSQWQRARAAVERELGEVTFFDPSGTKDIVLGSTGRPMPLLHAQHGRSARAGSGPARADHVHMFCVPADDGLARSLEELGVAVDATASVMHRGMGSFRWRDLLTSDI